MKYLQFQQMAPSQALHFGYMEALQLTNHPRGTWGSGAGGFPWSLEKLGPNGLVLLPVDGEWNRAEAINLGKTLEQFVHHDPSSRRITKLIKRFGRMRVNRVSMREPRLSQTLVLDGRPVTTEYVWEDMDVWRENMVLLHIARSLHHARLGVIEYIVPFTEIVDSKLPIMRRAILPTALKVLEQNEAKYLIHAPSFNSQESRSAMWKFLTKVYSEIIEYKTSRIQVGLDFEIANSSEVHTVIRPANLEDALWIAFTRYTSGATQTSQCTFCGKIYPHRGHKDRRYCSDACRQAASRARRQGKSATTVQQLE